MLNRAKYQLVAFCLAFAIYGSAQSSTILTYQGRVSVAGKPFHGQGQFIFVIVDGTGEVLWSSGPFPLQQTTKSPPNVISLQVSNGIYSVRLGDVAAGMPALDESVLITAFAPKLRIWFNDSSHGWQHAGDEVPLGTATGLEGDSRDTNLNGAAASAIVRELRQLRMMVERQRPGTAAPHAHANESIQVTVPIGDGPALGRADAPIVLVEFTDYQCPYCKRFNDSVLPDLIKNYVDTGKLRIVARNLVLPIHPQAGPAALAGLCAHQQQKFWPMREIIFKDSAGLTTNNFIAAAEALKLDTSAFRACLGSAAVTEQVNRDSGDAKLAGITGTPSFVLGKPANGNVTGLLIVGARPFASFDAELKRLLASK